MVTERIAARFGLDPVRDVQVLSPKNRGGLAARALNVALQAALNPDAQPRIERFGWTFAPGDKDIQLVNGDRKGARSCRSSVHKAFDPGSCRFRRKSTICSGPQTSEAGPANIAISGPD